MISALIHQVIVLRNGLRPAVRLPNVFTHTIKVSKAPFRTCDRASRATTHDTTVHVKANSST